MTANPDSALRQALVAAEKALARFAKAADLWNDPPGVRTHDSFELWQRTGHIVDYISVGDLRRAREAHALIIEALQRGEK